MRTRQATWEDAVNVEPGDQLLYAAGADDQHVEAEVTVVSVARGNPAIIVRVDKITAGKNDYVHEGEDISAAWRELKIPVL